MSSSEIPRDFDELVTRYRSVLVEEGVPDTDVSVYKIASRLIQERQVLQYRSQHLTVSGRELAAFVGIPYSVWAVYVECEPHSEYRPQPLNGGSLVDGPFKLEDAHAFKRDRRRVFPRYRETYPEDYNPRTTLVFRPSKILGGYRQFLRSELRALLNTPDQEEFFELPEHLPQNNTELYLTYRKMVANYVFKRAKYGIDFVDAVGEVWKKILASDVLRKFTQKGLLRLPVTMTGAEVRDYLGISDSAWDGLCARTKAPTPVTGDVRSLDAIFKTMDVKKLDAANPFRYRPFQRRLPVAAVTAAQFNGYMKLTAARALANVFRSLDRHSNREVTLGAAVLVDSGDTMTPVHDQGDSPTSWENSLESSEVSADERCDHIKLAELMGVEPGSVEASTLIPMILRRLYTDPDFETATPESRMRKVSRLAQELRKSKKAA